jgi:hypothetical protein
VIGLLFLATVAVWLWLCIWLSRKLASLVPNPSWRSPVKWGVLILLLASPFVDEVIGKYQFEALCRANGIESADVSRARGKRVKLELGARTLLGGTIMPIKVEDWLYRDADNGNVLIQHKDYYAIGGWLMRYTPLSMGSDHSMLFPGNGCNLVLWQRFLAAAQVTVTN